ncbi:MAG: hypothetical protein KDA24_12025 [Deltaproteobacteria bacterium]|nr:hypothetical protein [Deltaproteobacteria bacterium]
MRSSPFLLLLLLLLPLSSVAQHRGEAPPGMRSVELVDPIDGHGFSVFVPAASNGLGGWDSDGCSYAKGQQPRKFEIVTSPTTLFSAPIESFNNEVPDAQKAAVMEMLLGLGRDVENVRMLPAADRYELAAAVARILGKDDFEVGELFLAGAWTVRDTIVGFLPSVQGASDAWSKFVETLPMVRAVDNDRGATIAFFDMARLAHRGGFVHERDDMLALSAQIPDAGLNADTKREEFARRVEREGQLLAKARDAFKSGLEKNLGTAETRASYRFIVGDLDRRLNDFDSARTALEAVELDSSAPDQTKSLARDVLAVLKVQAPARTVGVETAPTDDVQSAAP